MRFGSGFLKFPPHSFGSVAPGSAHGEDEHRHGEHHGGQEAETGRGQDTAFQGTPQ
jgi:hypothetical protein